MNNDTGVYTLTNTVTGDFYIGSAVSFKKRWARHRIELRNGYHHNVRIQRAWKKYGESAFAFQKIALCSITDLLPTEQLRIDALRPHYNICRIAGNPTGIALSAEARAKLSAASRGRKHSPETCAKLAEKARNISDETRAKIIASLTGKTHSAETRVKMSASAAGRPKSEEMRKNMSVMALGRPEGYYEALHAAQMRAIICLQTGALFRSVKDAVEWLRANGSPKATSGNISSCCAGKRSVAFGYKWQYAD